MICRKRFLSCRIFASSILNPEHLNKPVVLENISKTVIYYAKDGKILPKR
ncbi:MAG: hypothetical protein L6V93_08930 [Clostridiales bacterium]|nr:MAG: hypothetical protein L6V93_08930 [Clostridiales bacterium]